MLELTSLRSDFGHLADRISRSNQAASKSVASLSSGNRLTRAGDDVAALSVATTLRSQITTIRSNLTTLAQAGSLLQVMDGSLAETDGILQRMNALVVMSNSGAITNAERGFLQIELNNLEEEIGRLLEQTNFNGVSLFNGVAREAEAAEVEADVKSLFDVVGKDDGLYTVHAGDTTFTSYVETTGSGTDEEQWLLIGRGRDGWEFDNDGQGDINSLANGLGTTGAFDPIAVDSATINALLDANGLSLDDIEIRLKRATNDAGSEYQNAYHEPLGSMQWNWELDQAEYDTKFRVEASSLGAAFSDDFSNISNTSSTTGADAGDNYQRVRTTASGNINVNGGVQGFQYGSAVQGTQGTSDTTFLWDSGTQGHSMPYTEVYIRVKGTTTARPAGEVDEFVDPRSIKGLELWLDANDLDGNGISAGTGEGGQNAGTVSVWKDKSGNGADVLTGAAGGPTTNARTLNGLNVLDFDGNQFLINTQNAADLYGDNYTWYIVTESDDGADQDIVMSVKSGAAGQETGINFNGFGEATQDQLEVHIGFDTDDRIRHGHQDGDATTISSMSSGNQYNNVSTQMIGAEFSPNNYGTLYTNGQSVTRLNNDNNPISAQQHEASAFVLGASGSSTSATGRWLDGAIAEVIVVSNNLSTDERQRLESYLANKWGLEDSLPDGHLFEDSNPKKGLELKISNAIENNGIVGSANVGGDQENGFENVTYSLAGLHSDSFAVDSKTGEIRLTDSNALLDLKQSSINLQVTVSGEGVGNSNFHLPVTIELDERILTFQVGTQSDETLIVSVNALNTDVLFDGQELSVLTAEESATASGLIFAAIDKVTAARADVGAKQASVDILTAQNEQALRNQDFARGVLEDTDIAQTSTQYASEQVRLQAAVAVLAQANNLKTQVVADLLNNL